MRLLACLDPPWDADQGGGNKGANAHYALSNVDSIAASYRTSEPWDDECDALVFMWATVGAMTQDDGGAPPDAYVLARLLRLRVVTIFVWCKIDVVMEADDMAALESRPPAQIGFTPPAKMGIGQWGRHEEEYLLVCTRGKLKPPAQIEGAVVPRSVIYAPRGEHSEKPEKAWTQVIEPISRAVFPPLSEDVLPVEYNSRFQREGWDAVGRLNWQGIGDEKEPIRWHRWQDTLLARTK